MNIQLERVSACTLNRIFGYTPEIPQRILSCFGSFSGIFDLNAREIESFLGRRGSLSHLVSRQELDRSSAELARLEGRGIRFVSFGEPGYPPLLAECQDAPAGLYILSKDSPEELFRNTGISVVGTRDMSPYGKDWCARIVAGLSSARAAVSIVSGLAIGIDRTAHCTALEYGAATIAVLPTDIEHIYPYAHRQLAERIASGDGCALISDFPPGTSPQAVTFIRRNRIIAGMSRATILVESRKKGGGMITARLASDYGRDVFVLPGRIDDLRSEGCNILLAEKLAEPIVSVPALATCLGLACRAKKEDFRKRVADFYTGILPAGEALEFAAVADAVRKERGITVSGICERLGWDYGKVSGITGILESDSFIDIDLQQRCTINCKNS